MEFLAENPWPKPSRTDCYFYHTMSFPDGQVEQGSWTISDFSQYIGGHELRGKTVLDVGTASGFLAFNAERVGAKAITAIDLLDVDEIRHVPFKGAPSYESPSVWRNEIRNTMLGRMKSSFWYSWYKFDSSVEIFYRPLQSLMEWNRSFDVVLAGAIVEHISDPVSAIGYWTKVAREAVIVAFTPVVQTEELCMRPMTPWTDAGYAYAWWELSAGLYKRIFDNIGFDIRLTEAHAQFNLPAGPVQAVRPTLIATRRK